MKKIFISSGDINGIGPEIIIKALSSKNAGKDNICIIVGPKSGFDHTSTIINTFLTDIKDITENDIKYIKKPGIYFLNIDDRNIEPVFGEPTAEAGRLAGKAIIKGAELALKYEGALVTAPINKYSLNMGGYKYPGHTEFLAKILHSKSHLMILDGGIIKVALTTTHMAIKDVPGFLSPDMIYKKGRILYRSLLRDYRIDAPRITVCSLNPHAGDSGLFGDEEERVILPAVQKLNNEILCGRGKFTAPMPSDTAFTRSFLDKTDAYLVMYHDQGLIPLKLLSFGNAVNFTAGLPVVRTSPDHGTAYDIAGKNIADPKSFINAVIKARLFMKNRDR